MCYPPSFIMSNITNCNVRHTFVNFVTSNSSYDSMTVETRSLISSNSFLCCIPFEIDLFPNNFQKKNVTQHFVFLNLLKIGKSLINFPSLFRYCYLFLCECLHCHHIYNFISRWRGPTINHR